MQYSWSLSFHGSCKYSIKYYSVLFNFMWSIEAIEFVVISLSLTFWLPQILNYVLSDVFTRLIDMENFHLFSFCQIDSRRKQRPLIQNLT